MKAFQGTYYLATEMEPDALFDKTQLDVEKDLGKVLPLKLGTEEFNQFTAELGYKIEYTAEGLFLYLPDKDVIEARWNKRPELAPQHPSSLSSYFLLLGKPVIICINRC